jgi:hypothetical protein
MTTLSNTVKSIARMIDTADHGKVNYLESALQVSASLLGKEYGDLKAVVVEAHNSRSNSPTSVKTLMNDLISARTLVIKFGGADAAGVAINARNATAKRASYSPQVLQQELAPSDKVAAKSSAPRAHVVVKVDDDATVADIDRAIKELQARKAALLGK